MNTQQLSQRLHEIQAIKFGNFTLKSGIESPIYIDLRLIISYPGLLQDIGEAIWNKISHIPFDLLCGVPYTALPIATAISLKHQKPMLMRRKEAKGYGTKKEIEGVYSLGQQCMIIEDLITSGASILETTGPLQSEGLRISHAAVLIDREQGGRQYLKDKGIEVHSVMTISALLNNLQENGKINQDTFHRSMEFIRNTLTR
jgi:orotate phosphoribosyltransferase